MSLRPLLIGVPVTHQRLTMRRWLAICAALLLAPSIICASSTTTRHHVSRVSGVGNTGYLFVRDALLCVPPTSKLRSRCRPTPSCESRQPRRHSPASGFDGRHGRAYACLCQALRRTLLNAKRSAARTHFCEHAVQAVWHPTHAIGGKPPCSSSAQACAATRWGAHPKDVECGEHDVSSCKVSRRHHHACTHTTL